MRVPSLNEAAVLLVRTRMYPCFDVCNYILMCRMVREDYAFSGPSTHPVNFPQRHPLSSWLASMLLCFSSLLLTNLLLAQSPLAPFASQRDLLTATAVWYLINYCPFDLVYRLTSSFPLLLAINIFKEVQRTNKVHHGVHHASSIFPDAPIVICVVGILKGAGYYYMRLFERLVRGAWTPNHHEVLHPSGTTKVCLLASILFLLNDSSSCPVHLPHAILYLGVVVIFIATRLLYLIWHVSDPFARLEGVLCWVLFGGMWDSARKMMAKKETPVKTPLKPKKE